MQRRDFLGWLGLAVPAIAVARKFPAIPETPIVTSGYAAVEDYEAMPLGLTDIITTTSLHRLSGTTVDEWTYSVVNDGDDCFSGFTQ